MRIFHHKIYYYLLSLILVGCILLTAYGVVTTPSMNRALLGTFSSFGALYQSYKVMVLIFLALLSAFWILNKYFLFGKFQISCLVVLVACSLAGALWPLIVTTGYFMGSYLLGMRIIALVRYDKDHYIPLPFVVLLGAGGYGYLIYLVASFTIHYPGVYGIMLLAPFLFYGRRYFPYVTQFIKTFNASDAEDSAYLRLVGLLIFTLFIFYLGIALMPEVGHDALVMHLFIPARMADSGFWDFAVDINLWAVAPMLGDMIFAIGYVLGGESASRLINLGFIVLLIFQIREFLLFFDCKNRASKTAQLIFICTPITLLENSTLQIDSIWTAFLVAGSYFFIKFILNSKPQNKDLLIASIFMGFAMTAKAQTLWAGPAYLLALILFFNAWKSRSVLIGISSSFLVFIVLGAYPYLRAYFLTHNPIFPFYNKFFRSPYWIQENFSDTRWSEGFKWNFPYEIVFNSGKFLEGYPGSAGFEWILIFPALFFSVFIFNSRKLRVISLIACATLIFTFYTVAYLRYIFPSLVWLCVAVGIWIDAVDRKEIKFLKILLYTAVFFTIALNIVFIRSASHYASFSFSTLMSSSMRQQYLDETMPIRKGVEIVNSLNTANSPVAVFSSSPLVAGIKAIAYSSSWYSHEFNEQVNQIKSSEALLTLLDRFNISYLILDDSWSDKLRKDLITKVSDEVKSVGSISIRKVKDDYKFQNELIDNPNFNRQTGWEINEHQLYDGNYPVVVADNPIKQKVKVKPGREHLLHVKVQCYADNQLVRNQINWFDKKGKMLRSDIKVFSCDTKKFGENLLLLFSPADAEYALVYAGGHDSVQVKFISVSLKD